MLESLAYIELNLTDSSKSKLNDLVNDIVTENEFYSSDVLPKINGNVTKKAHFKLFYGINKSELNNEKLKELVSKINIKKLEVEDLVLFNGYQGLYKVLNLKIKSTPEILDLLKQVLEFKHEKTLAEREYKPHVTLAYVHRDYQVPSNPKLLKTLDIESSELKA